MILLLTAYIITIGADDKYSSAEKEISQDNLQSGSFDPDVHAPEGEDDSPVRSNQDEENEQNEQVNSNPETADQNDQIENFYETKEVDEITNDQEEPVAQEGQPQDGGDDIDLGLLDIVQTIHTLRKRDAVYDQLFGASNKRDKRSSNMARNSRRENYIKDLEDSFPNPNAGSDSLEPHVRVKRLNIPLPEFDIVKV